MLDFIGQKHTLVPTLTPYGLLVRLPKTAADAFTISGFTPNLARINLNSGLDSVTLALIAEGVAFTFPIIYGTDGFEYQNSLYSLPYIISDKDIMFGITKGDIALCCVLGINGTQIFLTTPSIYLKHLQNFNSDGCFISNLNGLTEYVEMRCTRLDIPNILSIGVTNILS